MTSSVRGQRPPAPQPLRLVQEFLNTAWLQTGEDELSDPDGLRRWLGGRGLLPEGVAVSPADLRYAVRLREGLRGLLAGRPAGDGPEEQPDGDLPALLAAVTLHPRVDREGRLGLVPGGGGARAGLAHVVVAALAAGRDGLWERLKVCAEPRCRWVFYDASRNRSAAWCNMAVCGARAKNRAYYRRRTGRSAGGDDPGAAGGGGPDGGRGAQRSE